MTHQIYLISLSKGEYLSLDKQIGLFNATVSDDLPGILEEITELNEYLSKCIFLFSVGSNDYIKYLKSGMGSSYNDNPEEYANYLLDELASLIKVEFLFER